jgi:23S rRNA (guanosine2251-2'-O)-methyltransferase
MNYSRDNRKEIEDLIFGVHAVIEAIRAEKNINKIMIQRGMEKDLFKQLKEELAGKKYTLQFVPKEKLSKLTRKNHQGVIAFISPVEYFDVEDIVAKIQQEGDDLNILVLDRITDVRNFGAIARTAECLGVHAIVIPDRSSALVTSDAIKTSAGALHRIPVCKTRDLTATVTYLKNAGLKIIACTEKTDQFVFDVDLSGPTAIIMGSEEDGIAPELLKIAHLRAKIPLLGDISSFNVGVATGVILYEKVKQMITS